LDGASRQALFFHVELPYIRPILFSVGTLCFIWTFNAYGIISVMTGGGPAKATQVVSVLMQKAAFQFFDYSMAATYAVLILIILVAVVALLNLLPKLFSKKETE
jgi:multiple sugar transport system permease protein